MIFSATLRVLAWIALVYGMTEVIIGFLIVQGLLGPKEVLARYSTFSTTGDLIDSGLKVALFAIALGTLAEISFSIRQRN